MQPSNQENDRLPVNQTQLPSRDAVTKAVITADESSALLRVKPPAESLAITLKQQPPPTVPWYEHPSVIAGVFTLFAVWITVWRADRRMEKELAASEARTKLQLNAAAEEATRERAHSREEAHIDRISEGRRTVYLETVGELVKAQAFLASLPARDLESIETRDALHGFVTAVGKISILGKMGTLLKARELNDAIQVCFFRCMSDIGPIATLQDDISKLREAAKRAEDARDHVELEMLGVKPDSEEFATLGCTFQAHVAKVGEIYGLLAPKFDEHARAGLIYGLALLEDSKRVAQLTDELISCVREELNLDTSDHDLAKSTARTQKTAEATIKQFIEKLDLSREKD